MIVAPIAGQKNNPFWFKNPFLIPATCLTFAHLKKEYK